MSKPSQSLDIQQFALTHRFKLTDLRQAVLTILLESPQPLGAYEILHILRKTRPSAEPPTVYRVLDFLEKQQVVHHLSHNNTFMLCHIAQRHQDVSVVFTCSQCQQAQEFSDPNLVAYLAVLAQAQHIVISNPILQISGQCKDCLARK